MKLPLTLHPFSLFFPGRFGFAISGSAPDSSKSHYYKYLSKRPPACLGPQLVCFVPGAEIAGASTPTKNLRAFRPKVSRPQQIELGDLFSRPAPADQAQCAEAGGKERECGGNMGNFRYCEWEHLQDC